MNYYKERYDYSLSKTYLGKEFSRDKLEIFSACVCIPVPQAIIFHFCQSTNKPLKVINVLWKESVN